VLIGDSVALTLGVGFERVQPPTLEMKNAAALGCGVIRGDAYIGNRWHPNAANCDRWNDSWPELIQREQAQVAVGFWGAWDMFDRRVAGQVMRWGTPELDRFLTSELDRALSVLVSTGARVVLLTAPYFEPPDLATVAHAHGDAVTVVDLHAHLAPNGELVNSIAGVDDIRSDGIHFSPQGADVVARWLSPKIVRFANPGRLSGATANASVGSRSS
jgi:hypothetical protein